MGKKQIHRSRVGICVALATVALVTFWPVIGHDFTNYDDDLYVTGNPRIQQGFTGSALLWAWTSMDAANWHPLTWISHMLDWWLFGSAPAGHHLTSLLLHVLNTLLLFIVLERATGRMARSAAVALLFAVHPLHVESVAWIAERKDVLSSSFWMLTMLAYVSYARRRGTGRYLLVVVTFALGLCAKPMLVTLPFVLLLMDFWPLSRCSDATGSRGSTVLRLVVEKTPLLVLSAASAVVTAVAQGRGAAIAPLVEIPLTARLGNAAVSYVAYLFKTVWPTRLAVHYPHPRGDQSGLVVLGCFIILVVLTLIVVRYRRRHPYLPVGWLWYLGTLVPVIGLVQVGEQAMADRYTYIPLIGVFIAVCWGMADAIRTLAGSPSLDRSLRRFLTRGAAWFLSLIALTGLAVATRAQVTVWRDSISLFGHAVSVTEGSSVAYYHLGRALADHERYPEAIEQYRKALETDPHWTEVHNSLGFALMSTGRTDDARRHFEQALRIRPDNPDALNNLGMILLDRNEVDVAIVHLSHAVRVDPGHDVAHVNLGRALARTGRLAEAIESYRTALRIDPGSWKARTRLGDVLAGMGRDAEAIEHYEEALGIAPENAEIHNNMATVLNRQGRLDEAIHHLSEAVRIRPDYAVAHVNLAAGYFAAGRYAESWIEVRLAERHGARPPQNLFRLLEEKMPEPAP